MRLFAKKIVELIHLVEHKKAAMNAVPLTGYYISTNSLLLDKSKILDMLQGCFWAKDITREHVNRFIRYSLCFGIYQREDNALVGFGRVISDYTTYAHIADIVIDVPYRKCGLGYALIAEMMQHPKLQNLRGWTLRTTEEARKLYEKFGFQHVKAASNQLELNQHTSHSEVSPCKPIRAKL